MKKHILQPRKALFPIFLTEFRMVMLWRDLHKQKALFPMLFTEFGIVTIWRDSHHLKASSQITSVPSLTTYSFQRNEGEAFNSFFPSRLYLTPYSSSIAYLKSSSVASVERTSSIGFSTLFNKNNRNDTADSSCCECAKRNKAYSFENSASFKRAHSDFIIRHSPMSLKSDSENRSESDLALFCNKEVSKAIAFRDIPISANGKSSICSLKQSSVRNGWR